MRLTVFGVTGVLYVAFMVVSGVAFAPYNGGHWLLWAEWAIVAALWLIALWGRPLLGRLVAVRRRP